MRRTTLITLLSVGVMTVALFYVGHEVTTLEEELELLNKTIVSDQEAIRVLRAEWSHLNETDRLRELAEKYLALEPVRPAQITSVPIPAAPTEEVR